MRKKLLRSVTMLTLLAVALSLTAWAVAFVQRQPGGQPAQADQTKRKTLRDLGRERDIEVEVPDVEFNLEYGDLRTLAEHAHAVVVGHVDTEESSFSGDDHIITSYSLTLERVLKDGTAKTIPLLLPEQERPAPLATPLKFVREGGVVQLNGHRVSKKLRGGEALKAGQNYVLFLHWSPDFKAYHLVGGISGAFLIRHDYSVKPLGSEKGMRRYDGMSLESLAAEVLAAQQD